mmetsp:Transcript_65260/g.155917  ORF Transcript_65260/g.155917 Transcript_65260/m.155917 type:complete len:285 (+) Transcript_65260:167-1021(+)|eukprot:CAMPEP_0178417228 /NCGR_PEP_ID=MMETSP0689_2-20121128/24467_1 /TAXON_ID=160604 /ORGANISM="Amphidinium massartii, Strain CS-259" /LENGTH=284 /DNA_ID=CAMNT_0020038589 /DNA_START=110 /DNA_END=964 /DNA_ORIENTATION=+
METGLDTSISSIIAMYELPGADTTLDCPSVAKDEEDMAMTYWQIGSQRCEDDSTTSMHLCKAFGAVGCQRQPLVCPPPGLHELDDVSTDAPSEPTASPVSFSAASTAPCLSADEQNFMQQSSNYSQHAAAGPGPQSTHCRSSRRRRDSQPHDALTPAQVYENKVTSVMIYRLPRTLTQEQLVGELNSSGFTYMFDYVYLPTKIPCAENLGYAFVNFRTLDSAATFVNMWGGNCCGKRYCHLGNLIIFEAARQGLDAQAKQSRNKKNHRIKNPRYQPLTMPTIEL